MNTMFLLMAQYEGLPIIPADRVREDFFSHLTLPKFLRKIKDGDVALPLVSIEASPKSAKGVHLADLAQYIDERRKVAKRDFDRLHR